jgi:hypothetical protein
LVLYDFATNPSEFPYMYMRKILFSFLSVCYLNLNLAKATPPRLMRSSPNLKSEKRVCFPYTRSLIYCQLKRTLR